MSFDDKDPLGPFKCDVLFDWPVIDQQALNILYTLTYPICCTISNVFLLLTFLAYLILPELRDLHRNDVTGVAK